MSKPITVKFQGKKIEATTKGKGKYELHYLKIHGATVSTAMGFSQIEFCVDLHKTKLGLHWDAFCKGLDPVIKIIGWRHPKK